MKKYLVISIVVLTLYAPVSFAATTKVKEKPSLASTLSASVGVAVNTSYLNVEKFRTDTYAQILTARDTTGKEIKSFEVANIKKASIDNTKPLDGTQKPITYVRLFFLVVLAFIFGNPIVFYALCAFLLFLILRFIYRKIRNR